MIMQEKESVLSYSFGQIKVKVGVDGPVDRPDQLVDHMMTTATSVPGIDAIQFGIASNNRSESRTKEEFSSTVQFGSDSSIEARAQIIFDLDRHVSRRTLNNIVFCDFLPKVWETAGLYLGDNQAMTAPQAPLTQRPRKDISDKIDDVLSIGPSVAGEMPSEQPPGDQPLHRQLASSLTSRVTRR
jgi:hypothetical protein